MSGEEQRTATPGHVHEWSPTGLDWPSEIFTCTRCGLTGDRQMGARLEAWEAFGAMITSIVREAEAFSEKQPGAARRWLGVLGEHAAILTSNLMDA